MIRPRSAEFRLAAYYFAHFATVGTLVPYIALWLSGLGHEPGWIGTVIAAPSLLMLVTTVSLGGWADRLVDWRTAIVAANWSTLALLAVWLLDTGPLTIVLVWTLSGVLVMAKQPVMDAAALALTARENIPYGRVRAFGSIGFIVALLIGGQLFEDDNVQRFLPMVLIVATLRVLVSHALPRLRASRGTPDASIVRATAADERPALLRHPGFLAVLAGSALINASHAFYYTFGLLHWKSLGIATTTGSLLWAVAIVAEVALMWRFASVAKRLSPRHCLLLAASSGVLRWALALSSTALPVLAVAQVLHAATFGLTFLATVNFIAKRVDEAHAARAQSVLAILSTGSLAVATMASGWLYERVTGQGYLAMLLLALAGLLLVAWSYRSDLDDVS